jgi:hypothetical protein
MTWWTGQNLDKPVFAKDGREWHFQVWHGHLDGVYTQRIFFWDSDDSFSGLVEFTNDESRHISKLKDLFIKLANNESYRNRFQCELQFPLEGHY